jgi:hypothetical protein
LARRRSRRRGLLAAATVAVIAVGGGLWALRQGNDVPTVERCTATVDGTDWYLSPAQARNAALVAGESVHRGLPARAATIALATALQESKLINLPSGDRDSIGLFQQRPSQGWGTAEQIADPQYATGKFYDALVRVRGYADMDVTVAAQAVQRSGFPEAYAQHEARSRAWASGLTGHSPAAVSCELDPVAAPRSSDEVARELTTRAERDLGLHGDAVAAVEAADGGRATATVHAASLVGDDAARAGWAAAQWAVATASATDVVEVRVADRVWSRADAVRAARTGDAAWRPAEERALPPGDVAVVLAIAAG